MNEVHVDSPRKRIGWFCSLVPEELIMAAGLDPVRLRGRVGEVQQADAYASSNLCPYLKNLLDSGLRREFNDVDGVVFASSCDGMRRVFDLWNEYVDTPEAFMLEVPKNTTQEAVAYFADRLVDLKTRLGDRYGVEMTDEKLRQAISDMNEHRELVAALFEGQKANPSVHRGSELLSLLDREATQPKDATCEELADAVARRGKLDSTREHPLRVLIAGNLVDRPTLAEMVEAAGGSVVALDTCNGFKHYADLVDESLPPIEALAQRYLLKPSCGRMPGFETRLDRLERLVRDYSVQGVIHSSLKFCDYSLFEAPQVEKRLKDLGLPSFRH